MTGWMPVLLQQNSDGGEGFKVVIGVIFFLLWIVAQVAGTIAEKRKKKQQDDDMEIGEDGAMEPPPPVPQRRVPTPARPGTYPPIPQQPPRRAEKKPKPPKTQRTQREQIAARQESAAAEIPAGQSSAYTLPRERTGGSTSGLSSTGLPTAGGRNQISPAVMNLRQRMDRGSLQEGIILAEILKPPVSMRDREA